MSDDPCLDCSTENPCEDCQWEDAMNADHGTIPHDPSTRMQGSLPVCPYCGTEPGTGWHVINSEGCRTVAALRADLAKERAITDEVVKQADTLRAERDRYREVLKFVRAATAGTNPLAHDECVKALDQEPTR